MTLRAQVTLPHDSMLPTDVTVNVWHFLGTSDGTDLDPLGLALLAFYAQVEDYLSTVLTGDVSFKFYDLGDPEPRTPINEGTVPAAFTPTSPTLPEECAVTLSMRGDYVSGQLSARRRGRIFLGPLSTAASEFSQVSGHTVPIAARNALAGAMSDLVQASDTAGHRLAVYSRVNADSIPVTHVWVDDALDTIRSRGHRASVRTEIGPIA